MPPLLVDLAAIPDGWFLDTLLDKRTRIRYSGSGEAHIHIEWECRLQHRTGGKLCSAAAISPQEAVRAAAKLAKERWPSL